MAVFLRFRKFLGTKKPHPAGAAIAGATFSPRGRRPCQGGTNLSKLNGITQNFHFPAQLLKRIQTTKSTTKLAVPELSIRLDNSFYDFREVLV